MDEETEEPASVKKLVMPKQAGITWQGSRVLVEQMDAAELGRLLKRELKRLDRKIAAGMKGHRSLGVEHNFQLRMDVVEWQLIDGLPDEVYEAARDEVKQFELGTIPAVRLIVWEEGGSDTDPVGP